MYYILISCLFAFAKIVADEQHNVDYTQNHFGIHEQFPSYPKIELNYGWYSGVMDFFGSWFFDAPVTEDLKQQLTNQLPQLTSAWEKDAPSLFMELFSTFQKGIKVENRNALINLSHGSSYGSHWFLIFGLRWFLDPEPWNCSVSKEDAFSALVFHELLHVWVDENVHKDRSILLQKYRDEDSLVLDHLHLMAIQKMIYLNIKRCFEESVEFFIIKRV